MGITRRQDVKGNAKATEALFWATKSSAACLMLVQTTLNRKSTLRYGHVSQKWTQHLAVLYKICLNTLILQIQKIGRFEPKPLSQWCSISLSCWSCRSWICLCHGKRETWHQILQAVFKTNATSGRLSLSTQLFEACLSVCEMSWGRWWLLLWSLNAKLKCSRTSSNLRYVLACWKTGIKEPDPIVSSVMFF